MADGTSISISTSTITITITITSTNTSTSTYLIPVKQEVEEEGGLVRVEGGGDGGVEGGELQLEGEKWR